MIRQCPFSPISAFVSCVVTVLSTLLLVIVLAPAPAQALTNPERTYEMVTPPYKAGYKAETPIVAPNGESVVFGSSGVFAGSDNSDLNAVYLARRGASGWVTTPLETPQALVPAVGVNDYSASLESVLSKAFWARTRVPPTTKLLKWSICCTQRA